MGYYGRLKLKLKAQEMRKQGSSYSEIENKLCIPKSTVSDWCKDIILTSLQQEALYKSKRSGALRGSIIAANNKKKVREELTRKLFFQGKKEVGRLSKRERFIAGVAFYASEGTKTDKGCAFANSNPNIVLFMVRWFIEFCDVSLNKFRAAIWLHHGLDELRAKVFWSKITKIPINQFYKTYKVGVKDSSNKIRKNLHEYGVFTFYVSDVVIARRIMGWIGGVIQA